MQLKIATLILCHKKTIKPYEISAILIFIFFDPLSLVGLCVQNCGELKDVVNTAVIYLFLRDKESGTILALLQGISLYLDPSSWSMHMGFLLY